jgi:hypothetical protein
VDRAIVLKRASDLSSDILFRISESEGVEIWDPVYMGAPFKARPVNIKTFRANFSTFYH